MRTFQEYLKEGKVKQTEPDPSMAASLLGQARQRLADAKSIDITENNASFRFESAYEAAREAIQALMSQEGLKPYSHESIVSFSWQRKILTEGEAETLDRYREIRNDINYRGAKTTIGEAKDALEFASMVVKNVQSRMN